MESNEKIIDAFNEIANINVCAASELEAVIKKFQLIAQICPICEGSGEQRFSDAAGSRDYKVCTGCGGSGFRRGNE